ncbi:MAG: hypothetical protein RR348_01680 [Clostridia bacterium]
MKSMVGIAIIYFMTIAVFECTYKFFTGKSFCGLIYLFGWVRKADNIKTGFDVGEKLIDEIKIKIDENKMNKTNIKTHKHKENKFMEKFKEKMKSFLTNIKLHKGAYLLNLSMIISLLLGIFSNIDSMGLKIMVNSHNIVPFICITLTALIGFLKDATLPLSTKNEKADLLKKDIVAYNEQLKELKAKQVAEQKAIDDKEKLRLEAIEYARNIKATTEKNALLAQIAKEIEEEEKAKIEIAKSPFTQVSGGDTVEKPNDNDWASIK